MLYESTLVSDDAPYDRWREGDASAMTDQQVRGLSLFLNKGKCIACHEGPEFTSASVNAILSTSEVLEEGVIEHMLMGDNRIAFYDNGFYNIGVRNVQEDLGIGGLDGMGRPLSFTRLVQEGFDRFCDQDISELTANFMVGPSDRVAVDASFKVPTLRNAELTGPFFHTGRYSTLEQVLGFYQRQGDRLQLRGDHVAFTGDTTGSGPLGAGGAFDGMVSALEIGGSNLPPDIETLELTRQDGEDIVAFIKALTDERVRWERAPFDHPCLHLPNGDSVRPVGASGRPESRGPLKAFVPGKVWH